MSKQEFEIGDQVITNRFEKYINIYELTWLETMERFVGKIGVITGKCRTPNCFFVHGYAWPASALSALTPVKEAGEETIPLEQAIADQLAYKRNAGVEIEYTHGEKQAYILGAYFGSRYANSKKISRYSTRLTELEKENSELKEAIPKAFKAGEEWANECICGQCDYCQIKSESAPKFVRWLKQHYPNI